MGSIKHAKTSPVPNPLGDTRRVGGGDWNSEHIVDLDVSDIDGLEARLIPVDQVEQFRDDALAFRNEAAGSASDAAASAAEAAATVGALAAPGGAELVGTPEGTVQDALDGRLTKTEAAATDGSDKVGYAGPGSASVARTVKRKLEVEAKSFLDKLTDAEIADCLLLAPMGDLSAKIQAFLNENKGGAVVFPAGYRYPGASITLDGPTWDGTTILIYGEMFLRARGGPGGTPGFPAYIGMLIRDCDRVFLWYQGHGNRVNQTDEEHNYLVTLSGVTNFVCPVFRGREVRGDGIYITQKDFTLDSKRSRGLSFGAFEVTNSADDGRNAMTIISAINLKIDGFRSVGVGGVVGGVREPGGFCIEPNQPYQEVQDVTIGTMYVEGAGGTMMQIAGATNTNIGVCAVVNTSQPNTPSPLSGATLVANQYRVGNILLSKNVAIGTFNGRFTNAYGDGLVIAACDGVQMPNTVLAHVRLGAVLGQHATPLKNSNINVTVSECIQGAIQTGNIENTKITGRVLPAVAGLYSTPFAVWAMRSGGAQTNVEYGVSVDYSANWTRAYRNDVSFPVTFTGCTMRNCDLTGPWIPLVGGADMPLFQQNVAGLTSRATVPTTGYFISGVAVTNTAPAVGSAQGWTRVTTGTGNVLGTDWINQGNL